MRAHAGRYGVGELNTAVQPSSRADDASCAVPSGCRERRAYRPDIGSEIVELGLVERESHPSIPLPPWASDDARTACSVRGSLPRSPAVVPLALDR